MRGRRSSSLPGRERRLRAPLRAINGGGSSLARARLRFRLTPATLTQQRLRHKLNFGLYSLHRFAFCLISLGGTLRCAIVRSKKQLAPPRTYTHRRLYCTDYGTVSGAFGIISGVFLFFDVTFSSGSHSQPVPCIHILNSFSRRDRTSPKTTLAVCCSQSRRTNAVTQFRPGPSPRVFIGQCVCSRVCGPLCACSQSQVSSKGSRHY